jgi:hypothetical protein
MLIDTNIRLVRDSKVTDRYHQIDKFIEASRLKK